MLYLFLVLQTLWVGIDSALFFGGVSVLKHLNINAISTYQLVQLVPFLILPFCLKKIYYPYILYAAIICKIMAIYTFANMNPLVGFIALGVNMALFNPLRYVVSEYWNKVELKKMASLEGLTFLGMLSGVLLGGLIAWSTLAWIIFGTATLLMGLIMYVLHVKPLCTMISSNIQFKAMKKERHVIKSFLGTSLFFGVAGFLKSLIVMLVTNNHVSNGVAVSSKIIVLSNVFVILGVFLAKIIYQKYPECKIGWGIPLGLCIMLMNLHPLSLPFLIGLNVLAFSAGVFFVKYNFDLHHFSAGNDITYSLFLFQNLLENGSAILFLSILSVFGISYLHYFIQIIILISSLIVFYLYQKNLKISYVPN